MSNIWRKLNLKEQREILVLRAPDSFEAAIDELEGVRVHRALSDSAAITFLLAFVTKQEEITRFAKAIGSRVEFIKTMTRDPKRAMTKAAKERIRP